MIFALLNWIHWLNCVRIKLNLFSWILRKRVRVNNFGIDETQINKLVDFGNKFYTRVIWNFHFQSSMVGFWNVDFLLAIFRTRLPTKENKKVFRVFWIHSYIKSPMTGSDNITRFLTSPTYSKRSSRDSNELQNFLNVDMR